MTTEEKVLKETILFREALPDLLKSMPGRWVVFYQGRVQSNHGTEDEAYESAINKYGIDGGFVVTRVANVEPTPITAGICFGMQ